MKTAIAIITAIAVVLAIVVAHDYHARQDPELLAIGIAELIAMIFGLAIILREVWHAD